MSEKKINLESALQRLAFAKPSDDFLTNGTNIIRQNSRSHLFWNPRIVVALCAALLFSIGLNFLQSGTTKNGDIENMQLTTSRELQATDISASDSVFRFLCLTKSTVVINNSLNLGELRGFGEWAFFQTPDNHAVTVSLLPLRDWNAIGQFEDGVITLQLDEGDVMSLRGVGIGPSSIKRGGPFPVYGNIQKFGADSVPPDIASQSQPSPDSLTLLAPGAPIGTSDRGVPGITNIVAGVDTALSQLTQKYFGALLSSGECG